jgi:hypothetical protein
MQISPPRSPRRLALCQESWGLEHIAYENEAYAVDCRAGFWCDVEEFEARVAAGRCAEREGRADEAIEEFERGIALYANDLLEDMPYEDWALTERDRLRLAYLDCANRLAELRLAGGAVDVALEISQQVLRREPCDETAHRRVMSCYSLTGRRPLVVEQYRMCSSALADTPRSRAQQGDHRSVLFAGQRLTQDAISLSTSSALSTDSARCRSRHFRCITQGPGSGKLAQNARSDISLEATQAAELDHHPRCDSMSRLRPRCRLLLSHGHIEYLHCQHLNGRVYWRSTTLRKRLLCSEAFQHPGEPLVGGGPGQRCLCSRLGVIEAGFPPLPPGWVDHMVDEDAEAGTLTAPIRRPAVTRRIGCRVPGHATSSRSTSAVAECLGRRIADAFAGAAASPPTANATSFAMGLGTVMGCGRAGERRSQPSRSAPR